MCCLHQLLICLFFIMLIVILCSLLSYSYLRGIWFVFWVVNILSSEAQVGGWSFASHHTWISIASTQRLRKLHARHFLAGYGKFWVFLFYLKHAISRTLVDAYSRGSPTVAHTWASCVSSIHGLVRLGVPSLWLRSSWSFGCGSKLGTPLRFACHKWRNWSKCWDVLLICCFVNIDP